MRSCPLRRERTYILQYLHGDQYLQTENRVRCFTGPEKMNPDAVVVACGCYVQAAGGKLEEDEAVDLIIGNNRKKEIPEILDEYFREREEGKAAKASG